MFYLLCLVVFGAGAYFFNYGTKQKSTVIKVSATIVSVGAIALLILTAMYGHIGKGSWEKHKMDGPARMCPMMMEKMEMQKGGCGCDSGDCACGNNAKVEVQRPPIGPEKYHQPVRHLMTDPMESKPIKK